jgi:hypothetical protein
MNWSHIRPSPSTVWDSSPEQPLGPSAPPAVPTPPLSMAQRRAAASP